MIQKIDESLVQSNYPITPADSSLFIKKHGDKIGAVLLYVDGLIIIGDDNAEIHKTKKNMLV